MTAILPVNIDFVSWLNELRNSFPTQDLPRLSSENDWRLLPAMLKSNRCFENSYLPEASGFKDWRTWASEFLLSIGA